MIVVTGATGQLGQLVIRSLLKKLPPSKIIATARNLDKAKDLAAQGVEVRRADYADPESLVKAFTGAEKLLLISSSELGSRVPQHRAVIEAAKQVGVKLLAYTSILHADTSPLALATEHRETEAMLRASHLPFVLLRNGWYTENYTGSIPAALANGVVLGAAGRGRIATAARADYADAAAAVLTLPNQAGLVYELAGDSAFTLEEFAADIARQSGRTVSYQNLPATEYKAALVGFGLPDFVADILADSDIGASSGALFDDSRQLSRLIGRPTTPFSVSIAAALSG